MAERVVKVKLSATIDQYEAAMKKAAQSTREVGDEAAKLAQTREALDTLGRSALGLGVALGVGVAVAIGRFVEFDKAMSNVQAATQESRGNMNDLRDAALEAGASTVYTATEAATAIEALGKASLTTEHILEGGLTGALDLAAAAGIGVAQAAEIAAISMKQFGLEGEDIPHIADLLAAGAGKAVGEVTDLAAALNQAGLIANGAGQSIEDTTGVLAAFADAGLLGSDAGTSLKNAIIKLQAPTDEARELMEQYNLSFYDANGQMLGFADIAGQLQTQMGGLSDETRNAALAQIFGTDALRVANVLYDEGAEGIEKYITQTNDTGYAAKVAADKLNNLAGDVEKLGGAFDTALIKSGSGANDSLRMLTQTATGVVDAIGNLPTPVLAGATAVTALVAAVAIAGGAFLLAVPKVAQFKIALSTLNISGASAARGIGLATGALAGAGIAFSLWASKQAEATATAAEFQDSLDSTTGAITDYTRELVAKKLAESGAFEAAKEAGISQKELTDKIIEGGDALKDIQDKIGANNTFASFFTGMGVRAGNASATIRDLASGLETAGENHDDLVVATEGSAEATDTAAVAYQDAAAQADELESNLRQLIDTVNEANGVGQDAITSNLNYKNALAEVDDVIRKATEGLDANEDGIADYTATLDEATQAGRDNKDMLVDMASKSQAAALAQFELDGNTDAYRDTLSRGRQDLIDRATALGLNADEAGALADQIYRIPDDTEWKVIAETAAARSQLERFIYDYNGRKIVLNVESARDGAQSVGPGRAGGGPIRGAGSSTSDSILTPLSNGEHVWTAAEVQAAGGHGAVENLRNWVRGGGVGGGFSGSGSGSGAPVTVKVYQLPGQDEDALVRKVVSAVERKQK